MWDHYISFEWLEELCLIVQTLWTLEVALKVPNHHVVQYRRG